jgi:hypothetical protein
MQNVIEICQIWQAIRKFSILYKENADMLLFMTNIGIA